MKKTASAIFALGIFAALPAHAQTQAGTSAVGKLASSAVVKADWDDWHALNAEMRASHAATHLKP
jgi:hypothetical protein